MGLGELTGPTLERKWGVCKSEEQRLWPRGMRWQLAALLLVLPSEVFGKPGGSGLSLWGVPVGARRVAEPGPLPQPPQVGQDSWPAFIWSPSHDRRKWSFLCAVLSPQYGSGCVGGLSNTSWWGTWGDSRFMTSDLLA